MLPVGKGFGEKFGYLLHFGYGGQSFDLDAVAVVVAVDAGVVGKSTKPSVFQHLSRRGFLLEEFCVEVERHIFIGLFGRSQVAQRLASMHFL